MGREPKILTWDIECTDLEITKRQYGLKNYIKYDSPNNITRDWTLLGAAVKWYGKKPQCISVNSKDPLNDYEVTHWLHGYLSKADMIIGHNSRAFDYKKFNTRAITYGLTPVFFAPRFNYDTLTMARKYFSFTSNKLSYLADKLEVENKQDSPDWEACINGCPKALSYMRKYNKADVIVTEQVYDKLKSYDEHHPDLSGIRDLRDTNGDPVLSCKACGSLDIIKNGVDIGAGKTTLGKKKQKYFCKTCGVATRENRWTS